MKTRNKASLCGIMTDPLCYYSCMIQCVRMLSRDNRTIVHCLSCIIVSLLSFNSLVPRPSHLQILIAFPPHDQKQNPALIKEGFLEFLIACSMQKNLKKVVHTASNEKLEVGRPGNKARVPMLSLTVCQSVASCSNTRDPLRYSLHPVVSIIQYVPQL